MIKNSNFPLNLVSPLPFWYPFLPNFLEISPLSLQKGGGGGNYDTTTFLMRQTCAKLTHIKFPKVCPCLLTYCRHTIVILYGLLTSNAFLIVSPTKICKSVSLCFTFGLISSFPGLSVSS